MTYRIGIANEKGGVAKTTTTISLGAAFAEMGMRVLLVDLDPQANLSLALGFEPNKVEKSSAHLLMEQLSPLSAIRQTTYQGLDLIPSCSEMGMAERFLPSKQGYENILKHAFLQIQTGYDFIFMDCPPFLGAVTLNALSAIDFLLIPTQAEFFSIYALRNLMAMIRHVRLQSNAGLKYRLLLTMVDRRNKTHRVMCEQLRNTFASGVMMTVIEVDTKLRESPIAGIPIIQHAPKSRGSVQYRALAQEILEYVKETCPEPA